MVDGIFWPPVLHFVITVNRKSSCTVNEIQKKIKPSERQDRPLGKEGDMSVKVLEDIDLPRWVQKFL